MTMREPDVAHANESRAEIFVTSISGRGRGGGELLAGKRTDRHTSQGAVSDEGNR